MSDKGKLNISKAHKSPRPYSRKKIVQLTKLWEYYEDNFKKNS